MRFLSILLPLLITPGFAQNQVYQFSVDQDRLSGAADFSFLNHALTPADRLFVKGDHFYRAGKDRKPNTSDDERVRLFGVNLAFGANFPEEKDAVRIARRLRRLGVNLVRLHHMDSSPDREPDTARSLLTQGPYPTLNPVSVARLRSFLSALAAEGIYANLNLHVGYEFRPAVDHVPPMPEGMRFPTQSKPLHIFHPRMVDLQCEYTRKVIEALRLKNDPVLGMVEIDNETSLLREWQTNILEPAVAGEYKVELERQFQEYRKAGPKTGDSLRVSRTDAGPGTTVVPGDDYVLFLADRDRYYLKRMLDAVRQSTDRWVPVAGTQMGYGGLINMDTHADLDYQDNHFYIDHYAFPHQRWDGRDWRIRDLSSVGSGLATYLNMAAAREAGRPYTVSEFNQPWPNTHAAEIDPTLAAFGAFQDWDSLMHFAYAHGRNWDDGAPNGFNINGDWTKFPNLGQAAWLFRTGAIRSGLKPVDIPVSKEMRVQAAREKVNGRISTFLEKAAGYDAALAMLHPVRLAKDKSGSLPAMKAEAPYRSDTGELEYDPAGKVFVIGARKAAGVFGFVGAGKKASAGALDVELSASSRGFVSLLLTSLDGRPLEQSRRMLLSMPGYTLCVQPGSEPPRPQKLIHYPETTDWWTLEPEPSYPSKQSGTMNSGPGPVWMERVEATVTLHTSVRRIAVYPLDGAGARMKPISSRDIEPVKGGFRIRLQSDGQDFAPWYEVTE